MKKIIGLVLIVSLTILLSGCSFMKDTPFEGLGNSLAKPFKAVFGEHPERPLKNFLQAMYSKDYAKATTYLSEAGNKFYPEKNMENFAVGTKFKLTTVEFQNETTARVYYTLKDSSGQLALMKKIGPAWKVEEFGDDEYDRFDD